ncbi:PREDICTED: programmed cell death 6-interacting protein-like isoform X3 [Branchiostoma belcheri]|uniref:Programmed cell death 6-interacting protein n=1 Tax=Branchiostoma belcheri TaxID=7741 RepID=A0A6P4Z0S0_BRABE|nr:PREDICTED: programmed cell death 6-interacting protein-like isoform X3 [Branchiostoma belcheri]
MASSFLSVPLKKSQAVDLVKPLEKFIKNTYSGPGGTQDDFTPQLKELDKLRESATGKTLDRHDSSLEIIQKYYDQLCAIEAKLPITENQIRVNFTWYDAFDQGMLFLGKMKKTMSSGDYERMCVLFNIGALMSQIAAAQNISADDGLKNAAKYLQQAAGVFTHIKDSMAGPFQQVVTPDLSLEMLSTLAVVMLAQAQEAILLKSIQDKMKEAIIAKLSMQASDLYSDAMKQAQNPHFGDLLPKEWIPTLAGKQAMYHAQAEFYMSLMAKKNKNIGEEIARLKHALELAKTGGSRAGSTMDLKDFTGKIQRAHDAADKDNNFIYHDRVPELNTLPAIGRAAVAKALPLSKPMNPKSTDLFEKLVPLAVHQALTGYEARKADVVNREVGRLREATQLMNSVLASLNLPAAIEDLSGDSIPQSILDKGAAIKDKGGIDKINQLIQDLPELLQRNKEVLDEANRVLDDEEKTDNELRANFKERWARTPSAQLYSPLRAEGGKYQSILDNAIHADAIVREKYNKHAENITLLCKPEELPGKIPSSSPAAALQGSKCVTDLRQLMEEVETIKAERDVIESEIKEAKSDISSKFLTALAQDGVVNEESLSVGELDRMFGPLQQQVTESVGRQESLMGKIQTANTEFCQQKQASGSVNQREEKLKDLAAAHDAFMELISNLEEGTKFYNELLLLLVKFQTKCNDIVFARKTEKDEHLKDLQQNIAKQPSQSAPTPPAYQASGPGGAAKAPPPRPPPPQVQPQQQPQQAQPPAQQAAAGSQPQLNMPQPGQPQYGYNNPQYYSPPPMPTSYNPYATMQYQPPPQQGATAPYGQQPGAPPYPQQQQAAPPYPQQQYAPQYPQPAYNPYAPPSQYPNPYQQQQQQ